MVLDCELYICMSVCLRVCVYYSNLIRLCLLSEQFGLFAGASISNEFVCFVQLVLFAYLYCVVLLYVSCYVVSTRTMLECGMYCLI